MKVKLWKSVAIVAWSLLVLLILFVVIDVFQQGGVWRSGGLSSFRRNIIRQEAKILEQRYENQLDSETNRELVQLEGGGAVLEVGQQHSFTRPKELVLQLGGRNIVLKPSLSNELTVELPSDLRQEVRYSFANSKLILSQETPSFWGKRWNFKRQQPVVIAVPRDPKLNLQLFTAAAKLMATGLEIGQFKLTADACELELAEFSCQGMSLSSNACELELKRLSCLGDFSCQGSALDAELEFRELAGNVYIQNAAAEIELYLPQGSSYNFAIDKTIGKINNRVKQNAAAPYTISIDCTVAEVEIDYLAND